MYQLCSKHCAHMHSCLLHSSSLAPLSPHLTELVPRDGSRPIFVKALKSLEHRLISRHGLELLRSTVVLSLCWGFASRQLLAAFLSQRSSTHNFNLEGMTLREWRRECDESKSAESCTRQLRFCSPGTQKGGAQTTTRANAAQYRAHQLE